jgi:hypothetical protein
LSKFFHLFLQKRGQTRAHSAVFKGLVVWWLLGLPEGAHLVFRFLGLQLDLGFPADLLHGSLFLSVGCGQFPFQQRHSRCSRGVGFELFS